MTVTFLYVDGEYLSAAAYHWGISNKLRRAKVDYKALLQLYEPEVARVYLSTEADSAIPFIKFLTKRGFIVKLLDVDNRNSSSISAAMSIDVNADFLSNIPDRIIIVTGNGSIAPLCRVLKTRCDLSILGFEGSVSNALIEVGADTDTLTNLVYEAKG